MFPIKQPFYLLVAFFSLFACAGSRADRAHTTNVAGLVSSIDPANSSFVIQEPGRRHRAGPTVTVDTTASTTFKELVDRQSSTVAFSALIVGQQVSASGTEASAGTLSATRVTILIPVVQLAGTIASINSTVLSFTVQPPQGSTVTVDTSASTKFVTDSPSANPVAFTFADLAVGDAVQVIGTANGANSVAATQVADLGQPVVYVGGTIASINATALSFTVQPRQGSAVTIDTSASTKFVTESPSASPVAASFPDLTVGDAVLVTGTANGAGSVAATQVTDLGPPIVSAAGTVASFTSDGFVLTVSSGRSTTTQVTVHANSSTKFFLGFQTGTLADVVVGAGVSLVGTENPDGSVLATLVSIRSPKPVLEGTVANVSASAFTVTLAHGTDFTVNVTSTTVYVTANGSAAQFSDVVAGAEVAVSSTVNADGSVTATYVQIYPSHK